MIDIGKLINAVRDGDCTIRRAVVGVSEEEMMNVYSAVAREIVPNYSITDENRPCILNMMKWLFCDRTMQAIDPMTHKKINGRFENTGLYIYGNTGTGKTLSVNILLKIAFALGLTYKISSSLFPLRWSTYRADKLVDSYIHGTSLEDVKKEPLICINDLGSEVKDAVYMGTRMNVLRSILERRAERPNCITIITSNIPIDSTELKEAYGDRVISRLVGTTNFLVMKGPDHRLLK